MSGGFLPKMLFLRPARFRSVQVSFVFDRQGGTITVDQDRSYRERIAPIPSGGIPLMSVERLSPLVSYR